MIDDFTILKNRAKILAKRKTENDTGVNRLMIVEFLLIPERYALPGEAIAEVLPLRDFTPIPGTPAFVVGVINARGKIISVINLKSFLHLKEQGITELNKVVIMKNEQMEFGILVDAILGAREISLNSLHSPPATLEEAGVEYIEGVTEDGLVLLNSKAIISNKLLIINQK
ncbi:MAG: chemotaxis protein CheW [Bacteroidota bacterium]